MRHILFASLIFYGVIAKIDHKSKHGKDKNPEMPSLTKDAEEEVSHSKQFTEMLETKRREHKAALQSIVDIEDKSKQRLFVEDVLKNVKKLLADNQDTIVRIGHLAESPFPHNSETLKDALTKIFENIAFFSDLTMRFPKIVGKVVKKDRKFKSSVIWSYQYATKSGFLDEDGSKVLNQMAQQLELIQFEDGFFNPFDKEEAKKQIETVNKEKEKKRKEDKGKSKKDKKTKKPDVKKVKKEEL